MANDGGTNNDDDDHNHDHDDHNEDDQDDSIDDIDGIMDGDYHDSLQHCFIVLTLPFLSISTLLSTPSCCLFRLSQITATGSSNKPVGWPLRSRVSVALPATKQFGNSTPQSFHLF